MADPRHQYVQNDLLYSQESLLKYAPGGYHPVNLHDVLCNGQYKIHRKLGWGGNSTVWLARDRKFHRWVALKTLTAEFSKYDREAMVLRNLSQFFENDKTVRWFNLLLDSFSFKGANGLHDCLVFDVLGPTLASVIDAVNQGKYELTPFMTLHIVQQLLEAISFLHESGYAHGDLNLHNIAIRWKRQPELQARDILLASDHVQKHKLTRRDGEDLSPFVPKELIRTVAWKPDYHGFGSDICLFDFGSAFLVGSQPAQLYTPLNLEPPEWIFGDPVDHKVDLWGVGCIIYALVFGHLPFMPNCRKQLVIQMEQFNEPLPSRWHAGFEKLTGESVIRDVVGSFDVVDNQRLQTPSAPLRMLQRNFVDLGDGHPLRATESIIQGLMAFEPEARLSEFEAIKHVQQTRLDISGK